MVNEIKKYRLMVKNCLSWTRLGYFSKMASTFSKFLNHPAGPKTVFFWAPTMKWGLVMAGLGDLSRPADKLSLTQTIALASTGVIWSRYSMVIKPKNWNLFSVNLFVGAIGIYQLGRIFRFRMDNDGNKEK